MNNPIKPWFLLDPNNFASMWWKKDNIIDIEKFQTQRTIQDSLAHIIIEDGNIGGVFWHFSSWYNDDPNRYSSIIYKHAWPFNKSLTDMNAGDTVYLKENPNIVFMVSLDTFSLPYQKKYCKILEKNI
jgi:hypothetical protein